MSIISKLPCVVPNNRICAGLAASCFVGALYVPNMWRLSLVISQVLPENTAIPQGKSMEIITVQQVAGMGQGRPIMTYWGNKDIFWWLFRGRNVQGSSLKYYSKGCTWTCSSEVKAKGRETKCKTCDRFVCDVLRSMHFRNQSWTKVKYKCFLQLLHDESTTQWIPR